MTSPTPTTLERFAPLPSLILVNTVAVYGQFAWAEGNLPSVTINGWSFPLWAFLFAAALESIAIYLSYEAHKARMAGDSSAKLWAAAYGLALLAGGLNYWHWAGADHSPTPAAVAFAAMSTLSPWLWGIRSRSLHRDELRDQGLIEPRSVKFSTARWLLHRQRTWAAFKAAVWAGETDPKKAVALVEVPTEVGIPTADSKSEPANLDAPQAPSAPAVPAGLHLAPPPLTANDRAVLDAITSDAVMGAMDVCRALNRDPDKARSAIRGSLERLEKLGHIEKTGTKYRRRKVA